MRKSTFVFLVANLAWATSLRGADSAPDSAAVSASNLAELFRSPPDSAKPKTWWHWMSGCVSREGITADLESMKRVGLRGAFIFNVGQLPVEGPVKFENDDWWKLMRFAAEESDRLGLELGFHNCPGWSSSGGPWIQPAMSMQKVVWSERSVEGPAVFVDVLKEPAVDPRWNFYRDIAVLAVPDKAGSVLPEDIVDVSSGMDSGGQLTWKAPPGKWSIIRLGYTTTGAMNEPAPPGALGLECDKLDREGVDAHFEGYVAKVLENAGPMTGKSLREVFIDSYEVGDQDWSRSFREEFEKRRGYDPVPWIITKTKRVVGGEELTARFRRDWTQTVAELFADNYYGYFGERVHRYPGVRLSIEPYTGPFDTVTCGTRSDEVAAEFWEYPSTWGWPTLKPVASSAHLTGMKIIGAESFTGQPQFAQWRQDPYSLKATGDRAFCLGVNQIILHTSAMQPWGDTIKPGVTMGPWGTHFGRNQTWWGDAPAWITYLTRCQVLLQAGQFAGDICYLQREDGVTPGYDGDSCNEEMLLKSTLVDGRITMPCGISYRLLVLPDQDAMTPAVARKIRALVVAGAAVVGPKPARSPSLQDYPACDADVRAIAAELWDSGKVHTGVSAAQVLAGLGVAPDFQADGPDMMWIHRRIGDADAYFVSNQQQAARVVHCTFRSAGRRPELWDPATGAIREAGTFLSRDGLTELPVQFDPSGSVFVVFRSPVSGHVSGKNWDEFASTAILGGSWTLRFDPKWGGPAEVSFDALQDWSKRREAGIRYYSGTVTYQKSFEWAPAQGRVFLNLGSVKNVARVMLNGTDLGVLWKPPFRIEATGALKKGSNELEVNITNLWPNRLIGDEQEPDDCTWGPEEVWGGIGKTPDEKVPIGYPLKELPAWLIRGAPRASQGRLTFTTWKFYGKDSPLLESGLLGPVTLETLDPEER